MGGARSGEVRNSPFIELFDCDDFEEDAAIGTSLAQNLEPPLYGFAGESVEHDSTAVDDRRSRYPRTLSHIGEVMDMVRFRDPALRSFFRNNPTWK
jgi:hypothetical protein